MSKEDFERAGLQDPDYMGDSVYIGHDGYHLILVTNNGGPEMSNRIAIEPQVLTSIIRYRDRIAEKYVEKVPPGESDIRD